MRYALVVNFYVETDDPEGVATEMDARGLSSFGGPVLEAARGVPGGEVTGADVDTIREATPEEISSYFEE